MKSDKPKPEKIKAEGVVKETLPNAQFIIGIEVDGTPVDIRAHISGRIRMNFIKILQGDRVVVELTPYDPTLGRIVHRYK